MAFRISGKQDWEFPTPWMVIRAFWEGITDHVPTPGQLLTVFWNGIPPDSSNSFIWSVLASLWRALYGFSLAAVIGVTLGLLMSLSRIIEWLFGPLVLGVQSLPSICWLPVSILWFGLSEKAILFIVLMGSVGSITIATRDGLKQIPKTYSRVAQTFGASPLQRLFFVSIPSALPTFISGLKQGWSFAWRSLLAGELIRDVLGVGGLLTKARDLGEYPRMFAAMILILLISVAVDKVLFKNLEERVRARWGM